MVPETKEGVQKETDTPEQPASELKEQLPPQPEQPLTLDITKPYVIDKQGNTVLGQQILQEINRGKLARKLQSDLHKTQEEYKKLMADKDALETELNQRRYEEELQANLQKLGLLPGNKEQETQESFFPLSEENEQQGIDPKALVRQLESIVDTKINQRLADPTSIIKQIYEEQRQERDRQDRYTKHINSIVSARKTSLKEQIPNLSDTNIDNIVKMEQAISLSRVQAEKLAAEGEDDQALEIFGQGEAMQQELIRMLADAEIERRQVSQKQELEQQLEAGTIGELPKTPEPRKVNWKISDKKNADKKRLMEAIRINQNARRAIDALGNIPAKILKK